MEVLIIGASSYVGARLYKDVNEEHAVTGTYHTRRLMPELLQLDVTDAESTSGLLLSHRPDVIIHVANNASVRWCEENPDEARLLNEQSTRTIADCANKIGAKLIYISSFAANNPVHVYGETKLASEEIVMETSGDWLILQPSLVVGLSPNTVNDRFFNRILMNINNDSVDSYDNTWRLQLSSLSHISKVIRQAISQRMTNKILPVAIDEAKSRFDFASDILSSFNIRPVAQEGGIVLTEPHTNLDTLRELGLPTYTYIEMIREIVTETQQR